MALPYQRPQKARQHQETTSSFDILQGNPFWIWSREEYYKLAEQSIRQVAEGDGVALHYPSCCFNHIVGLPHKDGIEYPLYDYEKTLFNAFMYNNGTHSRINISGIRRQLD
jgi:hypothetical protein